MPHKMNARSCERVCGLAVVLRGYSSMTGELAGDQWNEGDVFCSVVRRVALPDAFFAIDGLLETFLTVLDDFGAYPAVIAPRTAPLPAVPGHHQGADGRGPAGVGRELAHEAIKEHAVGGAGDAGERRRPRTTCWPGSQADHPDFNLPRAGSPVTGATPLELHRRRDRQVDAVFHPGRARHRPAIHDSAAFYRAR